MRMMKRVSIGEAFPVDLILLPTGEIAFVQNQPIKGVFDNSTDGVDMFFDEAGWVMNDCEYSYNTAYAYKEMPELLKWLVQQQLIM